MEHQNTEQTKGFKMNARATKAEKKTTVTQVIEDLTGILEIQETMLAGLLRVTERTLPNWKDQKHLENLAGKGRRLSVFDFVVREALAAGVASNRILDLLDEPFDADRDDSGCILNLIVQDQYEPAAFNPLVRKQIRDFKASNK